MVYIQTLNKYYEKYWKKRIKTQVPPINPSVPKLLIKYSNNGAIANLIPQNSKVLDFGCGDGTVASLFLEKNCEVTGIDVSKVALSSVQKKGIKTIEWDLNKVPLPLRKESFDVAVFADILEHLIDPVSILKEAHRLLKRGGRVIIYIPNFARFSNRIKMLKGDPIDILHWEKYGDEVEHLHWFTKPKLKYLISNIGFKKIRFAPVGLPYNFLFGIFGFQSLGRSLLLYAIK